jgi:hypothetical protein
MKHRTILTGILLALLCLQLIGVVSAQRTYSLTDSYLTTDYVSSLYQLEQNTTAGTVYLDSEAAGDWYDNDWDYCVRLTIDSGDVDADLTNFPLYVFLNSSRVNWAYVQDDLDDLRFMNNDNSTLYDYEIEGYHLNANASIWVEIPSISNATDTDFLLYYGNAAASSGEAAWGAIWDSDYEFVYHMEDNTTSDVLDYTTNFRNGTKKGANEPNQTAGQIYYGQDFDGSDDRILTESFVMTGENTLTWETWVYCSSRDHAQTTLSDFAQWGTVGYVWAARAAFSDAFTWEFADGVNPNGVSDLDYFTGYNAQWVYMAIVANYTSEDIEFFRNGVSVHNASMVTSVFPDFASRVFYVGTYGAAHYWQDYLDEARLSTTNRTRDWIKAVYESETDDLITFAAAVYGLTYYEYGELYSENLLYNLNATLVLSFQYNVLLHNFENISVQFSQDNSTWESVNGDSGWTLLNNGTGTLNLRAVNYEDSILFYRMNVTQETSLLSPVVNAVTVNYQTTTFLSYQIEMWFLLVAGILFSIMFEYYKPDHLWSGIIGTFCWVFLGLVFFISGTEVWSLALLFWAIGIIYLVRLVIYIMDASRLTRRLVDDLDNF